MEQCVSAKIESKRMHLNEISLILPLGSARLPLLAGAGRYRTGARQLQHSQEEPGWHKSKRIIFVLQKSIL